MHENPRAHRTAAQDLRVHQDLSLLHLGRGPVRPHRAHHHQGAGVPAGHRVADRLHLQVWTEPPAGTAAGGQSHRMCALRAQATHTCQADTQLPEVGS